jgi:transcription elongation factor GreB
LLEYREVRYEPRGSGFNSCQPHQKRKARNVSCGLFSLLLACFPCSCNRHGLAIQVFLCSECYFGYSMNKAFTKETDPDDDELVVPSAPAAGKNYITPEGYGRLRAELLGLIDDERPKIVEIVHWAASNGDRSENGDYIYGKKRLREIDRRIRFLTQRLEIAEITDPSVHHGKDQVFFGATVTYVDDAGVARQVTILGIDEADTLQGEISWVSPVARSLLKSRVGDEVNLVTPHGLQVLEVLRVTYPQPA